MGFCCNIKAFVVLRGRHKDVSLIRVLGGGQFRHLAAIIDMNSGSNNHNHSLSKLRVAFSAKI